MINDSKDIANNRNDIIFNNISYCYFCPHCFIGRLWSRIIRKTNYRISSNLGSNKTNTQQLDNIPNNTDNSILSDNTPVDRGRRGTSFFGREEEKEARGKRSNNQSKESSIGDRGVSNMPVNVLEEGQLLEIPFNVDKKREKIEYEVKASNSIKVYLVDEEDYINFKEGQSFRSYNDIHNGKNFRERMILEWGKYYLLIYNKNSKTVGVSHEIYYY